MKFAIIGFLVVLVIAFFVMIWKAARDWRWYQIVPTLFVMLLAVTFMFPTAMVLKSRAAWHKKKEELEKRVEEAKSENHLLKYGDPTNPANPGIDKLGQDLALVVLEAGRRWRDMRMTNINGRAVILQPAQPQVQEDLGVPAADGDAAAEPAPTLPLIPEKLVVHAFAEQPDEALGGVNLPRVYLGEFVVTASTPDQVTITPTKLDPSSPYAVQQMQMMSQARSWALYELLPLDGHMPFIAEGSKQTDDQWFGRVDKELIKNIMGQGVSQETISKYERDGGQALDSDPPLTRWSKIEFRKRHSVSVDSPDARGVLDGTFFDGNGRAVDSRLQRGGEVVFEPNDTVLMLESAAAELIANETAKLLATHYIRPPNDYGTLIRKTLLGLQEDRLRLKELREEHKTLSGTFETTNAMVTASQDEKLKLEQDYGQVQIERQSIEKFAKARTDGLAEMKAEMIRLHRENLQLEQKLKKYHGDIEQRLDELDASFSFTN